MMQPDDSRYRRTLGFSVSAFVVTLLAAVVTFALNLRVLGIVLAVLAIFNLVNVIAILVQLRQRRANLPPRDP